MSLSLYDSLDCEIHLFDEMLSKEGKTRKDTEGGAYIDMLEERMRKIANGGAVTKTPCNGDTKPLNPNETETMRHINENNSVPAVFTCPKCGGHELVVEATYNGVTEQMKSAMITPDGRVKLNLLPPDMGKATVASHVWHCAGCGAEAVPAHFKPAMDGDSLAARAARLKKAECDAEEKFDDECAHKLCDVVTDVFGGKDCKVVKTLRMLRDILSGADKFAYSCAQALRSHGRNLYENDLELYYSKGGNKCMFTNCFDELFVGCGWVLCRLFCRGNDIKLQLLGQKRRGCDKGSTLFWPGNLFGCKTYVRSLRIDYGRAKAQTIINDIVTSLRSAELENFMDDTYIAVDNMLKEMENNQ